MGICGIGARLASKERMMKAWGLLSLYAAWVVVAAASEGAVDGDVVLLDEDSRSPPSVLSNEALALVRKHVNEEIVRKKCKGHEELGESRSIVPVEKSSSFSGKVRENLKSKTCAELMVLQKSAHPMSASWHRAFHKSHMPVSPAVTRLAAQAKKYFTSEVNGHYDPWHAALESVKHKHRHTLRKYGCKKGGHTNHACAKYHLDHCAVTLKIKTAHARRMEAKVKQMAHLNAAELQKAEAKAAKCTSSKKHAAK